MTVCPLTWRLRHRLNGALDFHFQGCRDQINGCGDPVFVWRSKVMVDCSCLLGIVTYLLAVIIVSHVFSDAALLKAEGWVVY